MMTLSNAKEIKRCKTSCLVSLEYLQVAVTDPLVAFERWSTGEVAGPEIMSVVRIGEEIVRLQSPGWKRGGCVVNTLRMRMRKSCSLFIYFPPFPEKSKDS